MRPDALPVGSTLGRFRTTGVLGRGGMGAVYRAVDEHGVAVALKVVSGDLAVDPAIRRRFAREGRAAASFDHPNVVRVVEVGEERGVSFIATELLPGGSLKDLVRARGKLPWREAVVLGAAVARALEAVHAAGLVHRDLKPENVLLDANRIPKLTDFGLVRKMSGSLSASVRLTQTGELLGTPTYLAPEQAEGGKAVDARADLHALGATIFALVAGRPPFVGEGFALLKKILFEPAPRLASLEASVPPELDDVVARLLEKDPGLRPGSATEVALALEALSAGPAKGPTRSRAPLLVAVGALVLASVAAVAVAVSGRAPPPVPPVAPPTGRPPPPTAVGPTPPLIAQVATVVPTTGAISFGSRLGSAAWRHYIAPKTIACSEDGLLVLSGGDDCRARLWEAETGAELATFRADGSVFVAAFAPDSQRAVIVGGGRARIVDVKRRSLGEPLALGDDAVNDAAFLGPDKLVLGCQSGHLRLWDLEKNAAVVARKHEDGRVVAVAVSRDRRFIFSAGEGGAVRRWKGSRLTADGSLAAAEGSIVKMALSGDGEWVATTRTPPGKGATIVVHEALTGERRGLVETGGASGLAFAPDGRAFYSTGYDSQLSAWSAPSGEPLGAAPLGNVHECLAVTPDSKTVLVAGWWSTIRAFDAATLKERPRNAPLEHAWGVQAVAWSADRDSLFSAGTDGRVLRWSLASGEGVRELASRDGMLTAVATRWPHLYVGGHDGKVVRTNLERDEPARTLFTHAENEEKVMTIVPTRDGSRVVTSLNGGDKSRIVLTDLRTNASTSCPVYAEVPVPSRDGKRVAFATQAGGLGLWDGKDGAAPTLVPGVEGVRVLASLPDSDRVLALHADGTLEIRELPGGGIVKAIDGPYPGDKHVLATSPGGRWAAAYAWDQVLRVWDLETGKVAGEADIRAISDLVVAIAFSDDERSVAVATSRGLILVFKVGDAPR